MESVFGEILADLIASVPGSRGAIFADWEGEAVDCAARDEDEMKIVGAHWGVVFYLAKARFLGLELGAPKELIVRLSGGQLVVRRITDEYFVALYTDSGANLGRSLRALDRAEARLQEQM